MSDLGELSNVIDTALALGRVDGDQLVTWGQLLRLVNEAIGDPMTDPLPSVEKDAGWCHETGVEITMRCIYDWGRHVHLPADVCGFALHRGRFCMRPAGHEATDGRVARHDSSVTSPGSGDADD